MERGSNDHSSHSTDSTVLSIFKPASKRSGKKRRGVPVVPPHNNRAWFETAAAQAEPAPPPLPVPPQRRFLQVVAVETPVDDNTVANSSHSTYSTVPIFSRASQRSTKKRRGIPIVPPGEQRAWFETAAAQVRPYFVPRAALPPLPPVPPQRRFLQLTAPPLAALASPENDNTDANSTCSTLTDSGYEFTEEDDDDTVNSAQTHDPEDDENENVELADDTDDEDSTMDGNGFSRFVMKRSSDPALRQLIKNDCIDAALAVQEDGFFFDALGPKVNECD